MMIQSKTLPFVSNISRLSTASAATKKAVQLPDVVSETSGDGVKMTCITSPLLSSGLSRVVAVFRMGARHEENRERGICHLLRRSFGLSTEQYTGVNLTRHLEQMGAQVNVMGTREHMIYTVDCAPNLASRAGFFLAHMATECAYHPWELKDQVYKLMKHDIDLVQRRDMHHLCTELLHEAAFGTHPDGTRLGNSLFSSHDKLSYSYDQISGFLKRNMIPGACSITLMNMGSNHSHMDPSKALSEIKSGLHFNPSQSHELKAKHDFVGGDLRRNLDTSTTTNAMLAFHVLGGQSKAAEHLAISVAAHAIEGGLHNISYADAGSKASRLAKTAADDDFSTQCGALHHSYMDHGLFGVTVVGSCGRMTAARVANAAKMFGELAKSGLTMEEVQRGKALLKTKLALKSEDLRENAVDIACQTLETDSFKTIDQQMAEVDKITPESVNQTLKQVLGSNKMALSVVGANTALTPPLALLRN